MSRVLPILFNTDMVRAILDGKKTVTRRLVKTKRKNACGFYVTFRKSDNAFMGVYDYDENERQFDNSQTPPCQPGDILYVRETWCKGSLDYNKEQYFYKADDNEFCCKWSPSIHMPKAAARIWLKVTDVRVERLLDITEEQAYREGVIKAHNDSFNRDYWYYKEGQNYLTGNVWTESARQCFLYGIWNGTLKKADYDRYDNNANPWVWVIEFERCEKPESEEKK